MLWRGSARLGGIGGIDFHVLGNPAELVRKLEMNADIALFVNLDMVYQLNQNFSSQLFDVLIGNMSTHLSVFRNALES